MKDYIVETSDTSLDGGAVIIRKPKSEKFRMSIRRTTKKSSPRPTLFNGIHRRRHRKFRI